MFRLWVVILVAVVLGISGIQPIQAAPDTTQKSSEEKSEDFLQVMAFYGAGIYKDSSNEETLLETATCGTLLSYNGLQKGEWFQVTFGEVKGWVSGWLTTFDKEDNYCLGPLPVELASTEQTSNQQNLTTTSTTRGSYADVVASAAATYGVSFDWLWSVVGCESSYNLYAVGAAGEFGPFQFMEGTFYSFAALSGIGGVWTDPYSQAYVAAWAFANGYSYHWTCA